MYAQDIGKQTMELVDVLQNIQAAVSELALIYDPETAKVRHSSSSTCVTVK
jgi:hypothetical protein